MAAACGDDGMARGGAGRSALSNIHIKVAAVLKNFWTFEAGALHARSGGHWPGVDDDLRRQLYRKTIGVELGHSAASHVQEAPAVFSNVGRVDGTDAEINGLAPGAGRVIGMHNLQVPCGWEIKVEMLLILAEVRSPDRSVVTMKCCSNQPPVNEISRVPDQEPGSVIKTRVSEVEVISHADRTAVRVVATKDGIAIDARRLSQREVCFESDSGGSGV